MALATDIALKNNMDRISGAILSGQNLNPLNRLKNPCSICNKNCLKNQACINCSTCGKDYHIKCDGISKIQYNEYNTIKDDPNKTDLQWHCLYCTIKLNHKKYPFHTQ
jgi:hypothetical protein